jgi:hypothetical protein
LKQKTKRVLCSFIQIKQKMASARSYNNLIDFTPQGGKENYKFNFTLFGEKRTISVTQDWEEGIGAVLWDCEYVLCQYLLLPQNVSRWNGAVCIEMGSGTALAATLLWHCGAISVATDLPEIVQKAVIPNINLTLEECSGNSSLSSLMKRKHQYAAADLAWGNDEHAEKLDLLLMNKMGVPALAQPSKGKKASSAKQPQSKAKQQQQETVAKNVNNNDDDDDHNKQQNPNEENDEELLFKISASDRPTKSKIDYIVGADMIYHTDQHEILLRSLLTLMNEKTIFIFVHRKRNDHDTNFIDALKRVFEIIKVTPVAEVTKAFPKPTVNIYEFMLLKK